MAAARLLLSAVVLAACLMTTAHARADGAPPAPSPSDRPAAAAEALFRDGRTRMEAGDYAQACMLFAESLRLDAALGTLFNLATCEEHTGKLADAWERYGELVERMAETDERRAVAAERRAILARELPWLTVVLSPAAPAGTRVTHDGIDLKGASLGVPLPVDPGRHEVVVQAPGCAPRLYVIDLARMQRRVLSVEPGLLVPASPGPSMAVAPRTEVSRTRTRTVGYVVGGVGVASVAAGAVLGVRALARRSDSLADCSGSVCRDASGVHAYSDARTLAVAADVAFGLGALAIATGAYLAWGPPGARTTGLRVTPTGVGGTF